MYSMYTVLTHSQSQNRSLDVGVDILIWILLQDHSMPYFQASHKLGTGVTHQLSDGGVHIILQSVFATGQSLTELQSLEQVSFRRVGVSMSLLHQFFRMRFVLKDSVAELR